MVDCKDGVNGLHGSVFLFTMFLTSATSRQVSNVHSSGAFLLGAVPQVLPSSMILHM
jgi:hypothetical protein